MMRCVLLTLALAAAVLASSHSEAPGSQKNLKADLTDFYMFRSYDPTAAPNTVTFIMNVFPLQAPFGGPNYAAWSSEHYYEINIDNDYDGDEDIIFQFAYNSKLGQRPGNQQVTLETYTCPNPDTPVSSQVPGGLAIDVTGAGTSVVPVPLKFIGPVTFASQTALNFFEWVNMNVVAGRGGTVDNAVLTGTNNKNFNKPFDYAGTKSFGTASAYHKYSSSFVHDISFPAPTASAASGTCNARLFTGARRESFSVALGRIFDLINLDPINVEDCVYRNDLANFNIGSFVLEVPSNCVVSTGNTVIAAWTTVREKQLDGTALRQVSRLGHPLINEVVIGLTDKDLFNRVVPTQDVGFFANYVFYPTLPKLINILFSVPEPSNFPRLDLVVTFLKGIPTVNLGSAGTAVYEALRLDTARAPTPYAMQKNYGVVTPTASLSDADLAGFPNGRRPGDDVVDIALRVMMGRLCHPPFSDISALGFSCSPADAPVGTVNLTDGSPQNAKQFLPIFPYLPIPLPGAYADASYDSCTQVCGDGMQQTPEQCDDGNTDDDDGCSSGCLVEVGYDCAVPGSLCDGICGDGLVRGTETCDTGLDTVTLCCRNCQVVPVCTCDNEEPTQCTPPVSSTISTTMSSTSTSTTTSTSSSTTSGGVPSTPSASRAPTSSSATTLTGGVVVQGCFSTLPPNDNENAICTVVRQERVKDGEYCGWCEEGPTKDGTFEFVWRYCEDGSPCAPDAGGVPLCNPVTYVGIGDACDEANRVVCRDGYYDVACVDGICGCVNCIQPGGACALNGKNDKGEDIYGINSGCQFGSCLPDGGTTESGTCTVTPNDQPCGSSPNECLPNSYCATKTNGAFCSPRLAVGADCSDDPTGCPWNAQCFNDVCVAYGSVAAGDDCIDHRMCQPGLGCNLEANPPVCFSPDAQGQGCTFPDQTGDACPDGYICLCNYASGGGECYTPVSGTATQLFAEALACVDSAGCTSDLSIDKQGITFFPDECLDKSCRKQIIAYYKAADEESFDNGLKSADLLKGSAASLSAAVALIVLAVAALL